MKEKANFDVLFRVANFFAEHLREEHQVVIMDPDEIAVLNVLDDGFGEKTVDFLVGGPGGLVKGDLTRMVVEKRPKDRVC